MAKHMQLTISNLGSSQFVIPTVSLNDNCGIQPGKVNNIAQHLLINALLFGVK